MEAITTEHPLSREVTSKTGATFYHWTCSTNSIFSAKGYNNMMHFSKYLSESQNLTLFPGLHQPDSGCISPWSSHRSSWRCACHPCGGLWWLLPWLPHCLFPRYLSWCGAQQLSEPTGLGRFACRVRHKWRKDQSESGFAGPRRKG